MKFTAGCHEPLGASPTATGVNFAVWSGHAARIELCLFGDDDREVRFDLAGRTGPVFHGHIEGLKAGTRYGLRAYGPYAPGRGQRFNPAKLLLDPYALEIDRPFRLDDSLFDNDTDSSAAMPKAVVAAPRTAEAMPDTAWRDTVIYELHVKGFTMTMPEVPEAKRGTFAGLAHPAAVRRLSDLGVTAVELLPVQAWIDEPHLWRKGLRNAWGYNTIAFCAPDPRLAPGGWAEVRAAVRALAEAGIETILDVVYNHTGEGDAFGPTLSLRGLDNAAFYRLRPDDPAAYVNDAGTGNILGCDHPAVLRLIMDSLRTWRRLGGVAGFRFDLASVLGRRADGFHPYAALFAAIDQDPELRGLKRIAEPWDCGPDGYRLGAFPPAWGEWNDRYRDDIRRFWRGDEVALGQLARRLSGSEDVFAGRPATASVNFVTAHDGFTLRDLVSYQAKHNDANGEDNRDGSDRNLSWNHGIEGPSDDPAVMAARARDQRNLLAMVLLSRGTPMLGMGSDLGLSHQGNNNAYAQDNAASWIDWTRADMALNMVCRRLIAARRDHPALRSDRFLTGTVAGASAWPDVAWTRADGRALTAGDWDDPDGRTLVMTLCHDADRVCIVIHRGHDDVAVRLPDTDSGRTWEIVVDTADDARLGRVDTVTAAGRSVIVLAEVAAPANGTGLGDALLARLSAAAGIERLWWTIEGERHDVPRETLVHMLHAMDLPCAGDTQARDSLYRLAEDNERRALPFAHVHHGGDAVVLPLGADVNAPPPHTWLHIRDEAGATRRLRASGLAARAATGRDGRPYMVHDLDLGVLPAGRYSLTREDRPDAACCLTVAPARAFVPPALDVARWGITAQLYAVRRPGDGGIGDFTTLGDLLERAAGLGAACVGINPLHALFSRQRDRASPYYPSDRRFLDPIYLDLAADGGGTEIDYGAVWARKDARLRARFAAHADDADFAAFLARGGEDLRQFALFEAGEKTEDLLYHQYLQWLCDRQLAAAALRGKGLAVGLYRDLAIGAAPDGAEAHALAALIVKGVSLGAPPDPFTRDGQVWGLTPFSPHALTRDGYAAMAGIHAANMRHAGALRIDHAIGLMRQFWVPAGAAGKDGAYVRFPCADLLGQLKLESHRARCLVVGEDLGTVPEGFREQMQAAGVLSYKVMPFERDGLAFRSSDRYPRDSLACVSTHDLPPLKGWWQGSEIRERHALGLLVDETDALAVRRAEKAELLAVLGAEGLIEDGDADGPLTVTIATAVHAFIARTPALLAMVQLEDLAQAEIPLNLPGTDRERSNWRHRAGDTLDDVLASPWARSLIEAMAAGRA